MQNTFVPAMQAEELVQEMWCKASQTASSFRGSTLNELYCYLRAILLHLVFRWRQKKKRDVIANAQSLHQEDKEGGTSAIDPQDHSTPERAEKILRREEIRELREIIETPSHLSERERECLIRKYFEGQTVAEIAEDLGIQQNTVRGYLKTGLAKLGKILRRRLSDKLPPHL